MSAPLVPPSGSSNNNELNKMQAAQTKHVSLQDDENRNYVVQPVISRLVIESKLESSKYTAHLK